MHFEYETKQDDRECVAYIDEDGDLWLRHDGSRGLHSVVIYKSGTVHTGPISIDEAMEPSKPVHKFYPGDKITITFE